MSRTGYRKYKGASCLVEDCPYPAVTRGWCTMHYARWKKHGNVETVLPSRITPPNPEGVINNKGYRMFSEKGKQRSEHGIIAEKVLGRPLKYPEQVHHVTQSKTANHGPFKLVICPNQAYHTLIHRLMKEKNISFKTGWPN